MSAKLFPNHYCPVCLAKTDKWGDHWQPCQYEASYNDWVNPKQPLTRVEMLKQRISRTKEELKKVRKHERQLIKEIANDEAEL